jgi:lysophospholipase L1-like esterase
MAKWGFISLMFMCMAWEPQHTISIVDNEIINAQALSTFFSDLEQLEEKKLTKIAIVHIGDSHIQADYLTGHARKLFQSRFGNAGRGFVFPYKIVRSSGARDVSFEYSGNWQFCDIKRNTNGCHLGLSGFTLTSHQNSAFTINVGGSKDQPAGFTKITLLDKFGSFLPTYVSGNFYPQKVAEHTTIYFDEPQDSLEFRPAFSENSMPELAGMILENEQPGILYHGVGINGTKLSNYLNSNGFEEQMAELGTNLVVVSFGTNEAYSTGSGMCVSCITQQYEELIARIRSKNPQVAILLTTPPNHYYERKYDNKNVLVMRDLLLSLAAKQNVAVWDLYTIMGGRHSILAWKKNGLARNDLVHFTKEGYELQGELLYNALMKYYKK